MQKKSLNRHKLFIALSAVSVSLSAAAQAQTETASGSQTIIDAPVLEEMLVTGRQVSGAQSIIDQRLEEAFSADILGGEQIARAGDSNIAIALTRVPGVTLVDGQYVYVRSLGERYSSVQLNGAAVPSPELTRNVLPLDLLPSSIVKTLKVQKAYSPDLPAHFGGGNVDIRTTSIPEDFVFELSLGTGSNSESSGDGLGYASNKRNGLPHDIDQALDLYQGKINVNGIIDIIDTDGGSPTPEQLTEARTINRNLMLSLDRDIEIEKKSNDLDLSGNLTLGNSWALTDDLSIGALLNLSRDESVRNKNQHRKAIGDPEQIYSFIERTIDETRELAGLNAGINYQDMHQIAVNAYNIRIEEDEAQIDTGHDASNRAQDGSQTVDYSTRYEERELEVYQVLGDHKFDQLSGGLFGDLKVDWFYSDATATTNIPGKTSVKGNNRIDTTTGELISTRLLATSAMASVAFLNLEDQVESYGVNAALPLLFENAEITLSGGYSYNDKARQYYGYTANINAIGVSGNVLAGTPGTVLTDATLSNLANPFELTMGGGLGTESYLAAQMIDAAYGMFDAKWDDTWRLTAGARYEDYRQAVLPIDLLDYSGEYLGKLIEDLQNDGQRFAIRDDGWKPSVALTYMNQGFMGAEDFQIRASYAKTLVRPDLRELSEVFYIDPELGIQVQGNPNLQSSELDHYDLRTEWVYDSGDNFTFSLFYKDVANPIEQSRVPGSDDSIVLTFYNAISGKIYGAEFEGLKTLGAGFFITGNITLTDSEIVSPADGGFTNISRKMTGQSDYVINAQLGYDSDNGMHSASLVYNVFGERIYYAARLNGHDDAFEQPFNSLDLIYSFFPTEQLTAKIKLGNLLNEKRTFEQVNSNGQSVTILEQEVGTSYSLDVKYRF
ncbi:TonB-dependent receptor domain-containing protein [Cellvibrio japonicus]|nr:TonB-dependent receptor [Cellvibrio japonicus]QEI12766.1 TonB-dependent receptor plug domain-containing protein [Cellvibrio japonicus]QEI16340.1 TonB-dependent receptor plug domain-containing protein [Cellvibrio japonicus]QEI19918.1 TonB-dependent receptor plug domain-containing protein [Cellvibrio japonicus]